MDRQTYSILNLQTDHVLYNIQLTLQLAALTSKDILVKQEIYYNTNSIHIILLILLLYILLSVPRLQQNYLNTLL